MYSFFATKISHTDTKLHVCKTKLFHKNYSDKIHFNLADKLHDIWKFTQAVYSQFGYVGHRDSRVP